MAVMNYLVVTIDIFTTINIKISLIILQNLSKIYLLIWSLLNLPYLTYLNLWIYLLMIQVITIIPEIKKLLKNYLKLMIVKHFMSQ